jgi:hypothetical protein
MKKRKSIDKVNAFKKAKEELDIIELEAKKELELEQKLLEDTEAQIKSICEEKELFCGIILTQEDIVEIVKLALRTNENITIPFRVYFKD